MLTKPQILLLTWLFNSIISAIIFLPIAIIASEEKGKKVWIFYFLWILVLGMGMVWAVD